MKNESIKWCISVAEETSKISHMSAAADIELAALMAEVEAAHKYQDTVYKRIMPVVCLWQLETGNDDRWPDLVVLIDWLQARGDKARAAYSQILDEREILEAG